VREKDFSSVCPEWAEGDEGFVLGYEFAVVLYKLRHCKTEFQTTVHKGNKGRIQHACDLYSRTCALRPCEESVDPHGEWSYLKVGLPK